MKKKRKIEKNRFFVKLLGLKGLLCVVLLLTGFGLYSQGQINIEVDATLNGGVASEQGSQPARFRVFLSGAIINVSRTINYTVTGTASNNAGEFTPLTGQLTLPLGQGQGFINVAGIIDDNFVEGPETVIVTLTADNPPNSTYTLPPVGQRSQTITINDNDSAVISISPDQVSINENGPNGQLDINMTNPKGGLINLIVSFNTLTSTASGPGAGPPNDFTFFGDINPAGTAVVFPVGPNTQNGTIDVDPLDDANPEDNETVVVTLTGTNNPLFTIDPANNTATVTIVDDDCAAGSVAPTRNAISSDLCDVDSLNLNTLISGNAPAGSTLRWSTVATPTLGQLLATPTVTASDTYYGLYWANDNSCWSPSTAVVVALNTSPNAGTSTNAARCNDNTFGPTAIDLDNTLAGADAGGTWAYVSGGSGNPGVNATTGVVNFNGDPGGNYVFRYTVVGAGECDNDTVNVTISVDDCDPCIAGDTAPAINPGVPTNFCDDITQSLNDYTSTNPPAGTTLKWSTDSDLEDIAAHLTAAEIASPLGGDYYGFFWDATNTCASPALVISLVLNETPTITATSQNVSRCGPGTVTLTATVTGNPTINWYNAATGGTPIGTGANFTTPNIPDDLSYWVEATENNCKTSPRIEVPVDIIPQPSAGTPTDTSSCSDSAYGNTVLNLNGQLEGADPGSWVFTSGPTNVDPGNGDAVDFIGSPDGIYVFTYTTTGAQAPCENESASVTVSVSNCDTDDDGDGLFGGTEQALGTDPQNADTDGDGIQDGVEVGNDINNPLDEDEDGIIDALDSNIADADDDGVVDQLDPANENPCIPSRLNGVCDFDNDDITDSEEEANGSDPDDPCSPNPDHENCSPIDLEVLKVVDNENAVVGDNVTFTITVNNLDPSRRARSIVIGDLLEVGFEYVSNTVSSGSFDEAAREWSIPELEPAGTATLEMEVLILEGGPYTNTATLLSSLPEDDTVANNEATAQVNIDLPVGVDLVLEKTALSANPLINEMVVFTIKVTNKSANGDTVNNIQVEDLIPSGVDSPFVYVSHEAPGTEYDNVTGIWTIETLGVSNEALLTITVTVPQEGTFTNTAKILRSSPADANPDNNEMTVTINVSLPNPAEVGFLYNQFSPNADGTNDFLEINLTDYEQSPTADLSIGYNIQIFNRYGNLVFDGKNMTEAEVWDGSWKGKEAPDGTYFYVMNIDVGNGPQTKKGWIQLIR